MQDSLTPAPRGRAAAGRQTTTSDAASSGRVWRGQCSSGRYRLQFKANRNMEANGRYTQGCLEYRTSNPPYSSLQDTGTIRLAEKQSERTQWLSPPNREVRQPIALVRTSISLPGIGRSVPSRCRRTPRLPLTMRCRCCYRRPTANWGGSMAPSRPCLIPTSSFTCTSAKRRSCRAKSKGPKVPFRTYWPRGDGLAA